MIGLSEIFGSQKDVVGKTHGFCEKKSTFGTCQVAVAPLEEWCEKFYPP